MDIVAIAAGVVGAVLGSAINAAAYRLPRGVRWRSGRSACPACGHVLHFRDLVPILSWLALSGKCRYCWHPIGTRYVMVEIALAFGFYGFFTQLVWQAAALLSVALFLGVFLLAWWREYRLTKAG